MIKSTFYCMVSLSFKGSGFHRICCLLLSYGKLAAKSSENFFLTFFNLLLVKAFKDLVFFHAWEKSLKLLPIILNVITITRYWVDSANTSQISNEIVYEMLHVNLGESYDNNSKLVYAN